MMAHPEAQTLTAEELTGAFNRVSRAQIMAGGDGVFLVAVPGWAGACNYGRYFSSRLLLAVINRQGDVWPLESLYGAEGLSARIDAQWSEDRWVAVANNNGVTCAYCWSILHIYREGDGWQMASTLELGAVSSGDSLWASSPELTLLDGYRQIALYLSPQYIEAPCTFAPSALYRTWKKIRREYTWDGSSYQPGIESDVSVHVVINAVDQAGRPTYRALEDWRDFCVTE